MAIELEPDEIRRRWGPLFCKDLVTLVDGEQIEIIEQCSARGPVEWDAVNRTRAGGVAKEVWVEGNTLHLLATVGHEPVSFGPVDVEMGGQALEGVEVKGEKVITHWAGVGGAGLLGACLGQAPGVDRAIFRSAHDLEMGGSHCCRVSLVTPKMERVTVGVDDTDTRESGATWALALRIGRETPAPTKLLKHRIVQLYPRAAHRTTNCVSTALIFATPTPTELIEFLREKLRGETKSEETHIAIWMGLSIPPELQRFGQRAKSEEIPLEDAHAIARQLGIEHYPITGERGLIGALAALGYSRAGIEAAALPHDLRGGAIRD